MKKIYFNRALTCLILSGITIPLVSFTEQLVNHSLSQVNEIMPSWMSTNPSPNVKMLNNNKAKLIQRTVADGSDVSVNIDEDCSKSFSMNFGLKRVYLSNSTEKVEAKRVLTSLKQNDINGDVNNSGTCQGEWDFDLKKRLQDWTQAFRDFMYVSLTDKNSTSWRVGSARVFYENALIWQKNQSYKSINVPIVFGSSANRNYTYANGSQLLFNTGINRDFTNGLNSDIRGLPYVYMKETQVINVVYNYVNRYMWSLSSGANTSYEDLSLENDNKENMWVGQYDLNNLIEINNVSYKNGTVTLSLNRDLFNYALLNEQQEKLTLDAIEKKYNEPAFIKQMKIWIMQHRIDLSNYEFAHELYTQFKSFPGDGWAVYALLPLLVQSPAKNYIESAKYGLKYGDNILAVWRDINKDLVFNIDYAVSDPNMPGTMNNKTITTDYLSLYNGITLPLIANRNSDYLFKINRIWTSEVNKSDLYISPGETTTILKNTNNLDVIDNNTFKLEKPYIKEYSLHDVTGDIKSKLYPSEMTDAQIIDMFAILIDNYNEIGNFSLLEPDQYQIERNEAIGAIHLSLTISGGKTDSTFYGFKHSDGELNDIDGSVDLFNLIASDVDHAELKKLMVLNKVPVYVTNVLNYEILPNNPKGEVEVSVVSCSDASLSELYVGKKFKVLKLQPFFISAKKDIDKSFFKNRANKITVTSFKENFLTMSDEFKNRCENNLSIKFTYSGNYKTLHANITYVNEETKQPEILSLTFNGFNEEINYTTLIVWVVVGILASGGIGLCIYLLWHKYKKPKLDQNAK